MVEGAPPGTSFLPVELLQQSFDHLEQPDILRSAAVCVRWRAIATQSRQYYRHIQYGKHLDWDGHGWSTQPVVALAQSFRDAVYEGAPDGVRLSVAVCVTFRNNDTEDEHFADFERKDDSEQPYKKIADMVDALIVPPIRDCLAHISKLDISCSQSYYALLLPALRQPAPLLEHFRGYVTGDHSWGNFEELPTDLFCGTAPSLLSVSCGAYETNMSLGKPIPAFANALTVELEDEAVFYIDAVPAHFPNARHLTCTVQQDYHPSNNVAYWKQRQQALQAFGQRLRSAHLSMYSASLPPPSIDVDIVKTFLDSLVSAGSVMFDCENEAIKRVQSILGHMTGIRRTCLSISPAAVEKPKRPQSDPYAGPFKLTMTSPTSLKYRIVSLSQSIAVARCVQDLGILRNDLVELAIPHLFLGCCFDICTSLPVLETLRILVYGRNRWRDAWVPANDIFKVSDAVLPGNSIVPQQGDDLHAEIQERIGEIVASWPALSLLQIDAPRDNMVEVDSQSLVDFIHRFHFQGSQPVLSLSGPMNLRGGVTAASFSSAAYESGFSDVRYIAHDATRRPTFLEPQRLFGLFGSMDRHQVLQYSQSQIHPSPFAAPIPSPVPRPE